MPSSHSPRRRSIQAFYRNGACWGLGNGLVSSSLIVYLAREFQATGFAVSLILATPRLVGVLRLGAPILIDAIGRRQAFCVRMFLAAAIVLLLLPVVCAPDTLPSPQLSLTILVAMWTLYHFLEFLGLVALWSWIGDVVPDAIRGRFIGWRGALLNAFQVAGMLIGGGISWWWRGHCETLGHDDRIWIGYAVCAVVGAGAAGPCRLATCHSACRPPPSANRRSSTFGSGGVRLSLPSAMPTIVASWPTAAGSHWPTAITGSAQFLFSVAHSRTSLTRVGWH